MIKLHQACEAMRQQDHRSSPAWANLSGWCVIVLLVLQAVSFSHAATKSKSHAPEKKQETSETTNDSSAKMAGAEGAKMTAQQRDWQVRQTEAEGVVAEANKNIADLQAQYDKKQGECYRRFLVNSCLRSARVAQVKATRQEKARKYAAQDRLRQIQQERIAAEDEARLQESQAQNK